MLTPFERASYPLRKAHFKRCENWVMLFMREHMVCLSLTEPVSDMGEGAFTLSVLTFLLKYMYRQRRLVVTMTGGQKVSWGKRVSKTALLSFLLFLSPFLLHIRILTYTHTHAVFHTDTCAMLRNQLIEVDMRKAKAVVAN